MATMKYPLVVAVSLLVAGAASHRANAETRDDGYCDYVQGVAAADSVVMIAPDVFAQFGYIEQSPVATNPDVGVDGLRLVTGVRLRLDGIYKGLETRERAAADCKRHAALAAVTSEPTAAGLAARAAVLDGALDDAEKLLGQVNADAEAHRSTAQEASATRLRIDELRRLAEDTHRALAALPPASGRGLDGALAAYQAADREVESHEGKLRRAAAFDLSLRVGIDSFLGTNIDQQSPYFAVVAAGVNLGALFQGSGNRRAAAGRAQMLESGAGAISPAAAAALAEGAARRAEESGTLEADLQKQLAALDKIGGDDSKRYRQSLWFEWIKMKAEHAYHAANAAALRQVVAATGTPTGAGAEAP